MPKQKGRVRFLTLTPLDKKSRQSLPTPDEIGEKFEDGAWSSVETGALLSKYAIRRFKSGLFDVRKVRIGDGVEVGDIHGKVTQMSDSEDEGPVSPPTYIRFFPNNIVVGFQVRTESILVAQAASAVSRAMRANHNIPGFRAAPILSAEAFDELTGSHKLLWVRVQRQNVAEVAKRSKSLGRAFKAVEDLVRSSEGYIDIRLHDQNGAWMRERTIRDFHDEMDEDGLELLEEFRVDSINLLANEITTTATYETPSQRGWPPPEQAFDVIDSAYDAKKSELPR